jgi:CheY-like chemotaxis protein
METPKLLLVDDNRANLVALVNLLKKVDCKVVMATSGQEALQLIEENDFALMLLDIRMPEMDGYEVAKRIRHNQTTKDLPIIFVTADRDPQPLDRFFAAGVVGNLYKPVDPNILLRKVNLFLSIYKRRAKNLLQEV